MARPHGARHTGVRPLRTAGHLRPVQRCPLRAGTRARREPAGRRRHAQAAVPSRWSYLRRDSIPGPSARSPGRLLALHPGRMRVLLESQGLQPQWIRSWGNRKAILASFDHWERQRPWKSLKNKPRLGRRVGYGPARDPGSRRHALARVQALKSASRIARTARPGQSRARRGARAAPGRERIMTQTRIGPMRQLSRLRAQAQQAFVRQAKRVYWAVAPSRFRLGLWLSDVRQSPRHHLA